MAHEIQPNSLLIALAYKLSSPFKAEQNGTQIDDLVCGYLEVVGSKELVESMNILMQRIKVLRVGELNARELERHDVTKRMEQLVANKLQPNP